MQQIAHTLPSVVGFGPSTKFGFEFDQRKHELVGGGIRRRSRGRFPSKTIDIRPSLMTTAELDEFAWFMTTVKRDGGFFWATQPETRVHHESLASPLADGSRTTFQIGVVGATSCDVQVNGQPETGFTLHAAANVIPVDTQIDGRQEPSGDNIASMEVIDGYGVMSRQCAHAVSTSVGYSSSRLGWYPVTEYGKYTVVVVMRPSAEQGHDYRALIFWGSSAPGFLAAEFGPSNYPTGDEWVALQGTFTGIANGVYAIAGVGMRTGSVVAEWYHGATALCPGDYDLIHHREHGCPAVIEFDTAPAAGSVITVTAEGQSCTRYAFDSGFDWTEGENDLKQLASLRGIEAPEVR